MKFLSHRLSQSTNKPRPNCCLTLSIGTFLLCACQTSATDIAKNNLQPHPIVMSQHSETVALPDNGSSPALMAAIERLGRKNLYVDLHIGPQVAAKQIELMHQQLRQLGINERAIQRLPASGTQFDATLRKERGVAQGCPRKNAGVWSSDQPHSAGFGCSVNSNMAAQIAVPNHIARPETLSAPNPVTAVSAIEAYQRGEVAPLGQQSFAPGKTKD